MYIDSRILELTRKSSEAADKEPTIIEVLMLMMESWWMLTTYK